MASESCRNLSPTPDLGWSEAPAAHSSVPSWLAPRMGSVHLLWASWWQCVDWQLGPEPRNWTHLTQQLSGKLPVTHSVPLCPASVPTCLWHPPPSLTPALAAVATQVELDAPKADSWSLPAVLAATALLWL